MRSQSLTALISLCILTSLHGSAQDAASAKTPQTGVVLVKLSPPVYSPLRDKRGSWGT